MRRQTLDPGTISSGTLREEDVIPALLDACGTVKMSREDRSKVRALAAEWNAATDDDGEPIGDFAGSEVWSDLLDVLSCYAPPFFYVGASEADGADIGVWLSEDSLRDAQHDGDVWCDPDDGSVMPKDATYRLVVSDHGNMSLYDRKGRELWGIV